MSVTSHSGTREIYTVIVRHAHRAGVVKLAEIAACTGSSDATAHRIAKGARSLSDVEFGSVVDHIGTDGLLRACADAEGVSLPQPVAVEPSRDVLTLATAATADTAALASRIAERVSPSSPGGVGVTRAERLHTLAEIDAAMGRLLTLRAQVVAMRPVDGGGE